LLLGLTGRMRSGKDTFASRLVAEHGFTRLAFADALKSSILEIDPIAVADGGLGPIGLSKLVSEMGWEEAKSIPEVRRLLQAYGVAIRNLDADFWVRVVMTQAQALLTAGRSVVITDVRFPNEADAVLAFSEGRLGMVVRPGLPADNLHISETALLHYPVDASRATVIINSGSLDELFAQADRLATEETA
jgi:hypothetical protein